ncbi:MAG: redoxin domain-containing protein [Gemmatimonadetes bacterium]|nr:redoxin domain-containing protein [Gemmatimonadota bacterium]
MFNSGKGVIALSISSDGADELASWAKDANFPMLFASDTTGEIAEKYATTGSGIGPLKKFYKRVVFVVGPDGRVAHVFRPFSALSQDQYAQLDSIVDRVSTGAR